MEAFLEAMEHPNSHPLERLRASGQYTTLLTDFFYLLPPSLPLSLLEAYQHAIDRIPQCIWLGNNVRGRYTGKELQTVTQVVSDAVAAAITAGEYGRALEWLEAGRAVVWSQVLQLRTPVDDLQQLHPQLAKDFLRVSQALQHAASSALPDSSNTRATESSFGSNAQSSHGYALEYNKLLTQIHELKGFQDFMQPKKLMQLAKACASGPVVVISVHQIRCDALVLCRAGDVVHVPLPEFSLLHAKLLQTWLWDFLARSNLLSRWRGDLRDEYKVEERGGRVTAKEAPDILRELLAMLWAKVVKPIMDVVLTLVTVSSWIDGSMLPSLTHESLCSPTEISLMLHGAQPAPSHFSHYTLPVSIPRTSTIEHRYSLLWTSRFPLIRQPSRPC